MKINPFDKLRINAERSRSIKTALVSLLFVPFLVFAQNGVLPNAGFTPESPFYFIDKLGEALREFFTFSPEGKARLQITFAAERIAEIRVVLETKGVDAKGLEVAQSRLQAHLANAATIVVDQKSKGEDVSTLAKELDDGLRMPKSALADSFKAQKRALEAKEDELKAQLKAAHRAGDTVKEEALAQELGKIKAQKELLELKEEDIEDELEAEEEKLEEEMKTQHKAERAIREAEEERQKIIDEAAEEGVELPANAFAEFDGLLAQAKSALAAGNFVEAKNLAKRAEKSLDQLEKTIEELEKKPEKKEEAEEAIKEAEEEKQEALAETKKEGVEIPPTVFAKFDRLLAQAKELFAKENYQGAKQLAEQAEDALENVDKEIEKLEEEKEQKEEQAKEEEERKREQEEKQQESEDESGATLQPIVAPAKESNGYTFTIVGFVHDLTNAPAMTSGKPMAGITIRASGPQSVSVMTRSDGLYTLSFQNAPLGTYDVCVTLPPGYWVNLPSGCEKVIVRLSEKYDKTLELINNGNLALHGTSIGFKLIRQ